MKEITKQTLISSIFEDNKEKALELAEAISIYGIHCIGCPLARVETLEQGFEAHQIPEIELDKLIKRLNEIIK